MLIILFLMLDWIIRCIRLTMVLQVWIRLENLLHNEAMYYNNAATGHLIVLC